MKIELNGRKKRSRAIKKRRSEGGVAGEGAWPRAKRNYAATGWVGGGGGGDQTHLSVFLVLFFVVFCLFVVSYNFLFCLEWTSKKESNEEWNQRR